MNCTKAASQTKEIVNIRNSHISFFTSFNHHTYNNDELRIDNTTLVGKT